MDWILLLAMPDFSSVEVWVSLLTITFLEIVLGIDNIIFISIAAGKLPKEDQKRATNIGLILAMILRLLLLAGVGILIAMQEPVLEFHNAFIDGALSGQSIILILGGLFLLYKSTTEIHHKLEGDAAHEDQQLTKKATSLTRVILQITLINVVFSFDSILTAVGLTDSIMVMAISIIVSIVVMMLFAIPVADFVNRNPSIQMLGLSFLLLIGFMLITEGAHLGHVKIVGQEIGAIPKAYLYFAIAFSLLVEVLNMRLRKKRDPVVLRDLKGETMKTKEATSN